MSSTIMRVDMTGSLQFVKQINNTNDEGGGGGITLSYYSTEFSAREARRQRLAKFAKESRRARLVKVEKPKGVDSTVMTVAIDEDINDSRIIREQKQNVLTPRTTVTTTTTTTTTPLSKESNNNTPSRRISFGKDKKYFGISFDHHNRTRRRRSRRKDDQKKSPSLFIVDDRDDVKNNKENEEVLSTVSVILGQNLKYNNENNPTEQQYNDNVQPSNKFDCFNLKKGVRRQQGLGGITTRFFPSNRFDKENNNNTKEEYWYTCSKEQSGTYDLPEKRIMNMVFFDSTNKQ